MTLIGRVIRLAFLALSVPLCLSPAAAQSQDRPKDESNQRAIAELLNRLDQPITLDKGFDANTPLKDALEFLEDRYEVKIRIDEAAWKKLLKDPVGDQPTRLPRIRGVRLGTVLQVLLKQVNGDYETDWNVIRVVPAPRSKRKIERPSDRQKKVEEDLRARLRKAVDFEKGIDRNTPIKDVLEHIASAHDLNIVVDHLAFWNETKIRSINDQPVKLPKMSGVPLDQVLRILLKQVGASYEVTDNLIVIVPPPKNEQS